MWLPTGHLRRRSKTERHASAGPKSTVGGRNENVAAPRLHDPCSSVALYRTVPRERNMKHVNLGFHTRVQVIAAKKRAHIHMRVAYGETSRGTKQILYCMGDPTAFVWYKRVDLGHRSNFHEKLSHKLSSNIRHTTIIQETKNTQNPISKHTKLREHRSGVMDMYAHKTQNTRRGPKCTGTHAEGGNLLRSSLTPHQAQNSSRTASKEKTTAESGKSQSPTWSMLLWGSAAPMKQTHATKHHRRAPRRPQQQATFSLY